MTDPNNSWIDEQIGEFVCTLDFDASRVDWQLWAKSRVIWLREALAASIQRGAESEKAASVEFIAAHKDDWKAEGAREEREAILRDAKDHYWESLESKKYLILLHLRNLLAVTRN